MSRLARNLLSKICANAIDFIKKTITSSEFINKNRIDDSDFTRQRKLPFPTLIIFLLSLVRGSYQSELDRFFSILHRWRVPKRFVTKAAFTKARMKFKYETLIELNRKLNQFFEKKCTPKTWFGFRLLVVDGSTIRLPHTRDIAKHFGVWQPRQGRACPMARLSQMYDPLNHITVDAAIQPKSNGEREMAADHFLNLMPNDLILLDRGYPAWWLFALILSMNTQFCARISKKWKIVNRFLASGRKQRIISLPVPDTSLKIAGQIGLNLKPLKLRLMRIDTEGAQPLVLITSLIDSSNYPFELFCDLYHDRWPVEEDYKAIKCRIELENFSGKSAHSIYQDFHAKVLMKNLASIIAQPVNDILAADPTTERKYVYQVNFTHALSKVKDWVPLLFQGTTKAIRSIMEALLELLEQTTEPIRPGRKYPRNHRISARRYYTCYKPLA
jgi:hypothetical protein